MTGALSLAALQEAHRRLELLYLHRRSFERDLERAFNWPSHLPVKRNQPEKLDKQGRPIKYNRAPPVWKGRRGYELVAGRHGGAIIPASFQIGLNGTASTP